MQRRVMYIEDKSEGLEGPARIGWVEFSKTGRTLRYRGREFQSPQRKRFKANYVDVETREEFWISGPRQDGEDGLYGAMPVWIDEDAREHYWREIRKSPGRVGRAYTVGRSDEDQR